MNDFSDSSAEPVPVLGTYDTQCSDTILESASCTLSGAKIHSM